MYNEALDQQHNQVKSLHSISEVEQLHLIQPSLFVSKDRVLTPVQTLTCLTDHPSQSLLSIGQTWSIDPHTYH
jgi:hypothetical protein